MVKYIGTRAEWQRGGKQRAKARLLGVFQIRPNVVFQRLRMFKAVNPLWADIVITDETEALHHEMANVLELFSQMPIYSTARLSRGLMSALVVAILRMSDRTWRKSSMRSRPI